METNICPKTWMLEAILITIFCCLPFGIVGIVYAARVKAAFTTDKFDEAQRLSSEAERWTRIGFILGLILYIFCAIVSVNKMI